MSQLRVWIAVLIALLIGSNAVWASLMLRKEAPASEKSYGCTETEQYVEILHDVVFPIAAAINASSEPDSSESSIVAAARENGLFANQTCILPTDVRIGARFGLRFEGDRLVAVSTVPCVH